MEVDQAGSLIFLQRCCVVSLAGLMQQARVCRAICWCQCPVGPPPKSVSLSLEGGGGKPGGSYTCIGQRMVSWSMKTNPVCAGTCCVHVTLPVCSCHLSRAAFHSCDDPGHEASHLLALSLQLTCQVRSSSQLALWLPECWGWHRERGRRFCRESWHLHKMRDNALAAPERCHSCIQRPNEQFVGLFLSCRAKGPPSPSAVSLAKRWRARLLPELGLPEMLIEISPFIICNGVKSFFLVNGEQPAGKPCGETCCHSCKRTDMII